MAQLSGSTLKRRHIFLLLAVASICLYFFSGKTMSLGFLNGQFRSSGSQVDEIYGLISLVTSDSEKSQRVLTAQSVDVSQPLNMNLYASKRGVKWEKELERLNEEYPIVVFSKTWCPYSRKTKQLLETYQLSPPPKIIEVDLRADQSQLKTILTRLTHRSTFPNVLLKGKSIGGSDDLHALHNANTLKNMFRGAGIEVHGEY